MYSPIRNKPNISSHLDVRVDEYRISSHPDSIVNNGITSIHQNPPAIIETQSSHLDPKTEEISSSHEDTTKKIEDKNLNTPFMS